MDKKLEPKVQSKPNIFHSRDSEYYKFPIIGDYREFACGWGAQMVNITLTYPVNKLIFRQMLLGINVRSAFHQIIDEGFVSLYRGILPPLLQKSVSASLMFGTYDIFKKPMLRSNINPIASTSIAAGLSGSVEAILTPFERIQTLLQNGAYQKDFVNMKHVVYVIGREYGCAEFYRGLVPILLRNGPSNIFYFIWREKFSDVIQKTQSKSTVLYSIKHFFVGASIGAINSTIFYPFNVIKVHTQSKLGGPFQSTWAAVCEIYNDRDKKIRNLYKGVYMNNTRSFVSWGLINLFYEHLSALLYEDSRS